MRNVSALIVLLLILAGCGAAATPTSTPPPPTATLTPLPPTEAPTEAPTEVAIVGNKERGQEIFTKGLDEAPPCSTCHLTAEVHFGFSLGPNLSGISSRAGNRIAGVDAATYIHQSILDPHSFVVGGYRDIMYPQYNEHFSEQDVADLVAYLLTL